MLSYKNIIYSYIIELLTLSEIFKVYRISILISVISYLNKMVNFVM